MNVAILILRAIILWSLPCCAVMAQPTACQISQSDLGKPKIKPPDRVVKRPADYYLLSLSWSPQFCTTPAGRSAANTFQCRENSFGFVVHGFWPQSSAAKNTNQDPRNCRQATPVSLDTIRANICLVPGAQLMQDEWDKHGTCAFSDPDQYFSTISTVVGKLVFPPMDSLTGANGIPAAALISAFTGVNPGLKASEMQLTLNGKALSEVRICYDLQFAFRDCKPGSDPGDQRRIFITPRR